MKRAARILVIEDERIVARELQQTLISMGYDVPVTVASADEALRVAAELSPDLALMDIRISGPADGIHTANELRRVHNLPVVFLTAYSDEATLDRAMVSEPFGYLIKPVSDTELRSAIEVALQRLRGDRQRAARSRLLEAALRSVDEAVLAADPTGTVTFANPRAARLLGVAEADAIGQRLHALLPAGAANAPLAGGTVLRVAEGARPALRGSITPLVDHDGTALGAVAVFTDAST
ncbi:MAG: response regulator [Myxococcales bacterium]|jgi:CheY-like chemotaxis protein|nr:response regulator [Myxococcales bacterium]